MALGAVVAIVKPVLMKIATHPSVKNLVLDLLQKYVDSTDNSSDDALLATVKDLINKPEEG